MGSNGKDLRGSKNPNYKTGLAPAKGPRSSLYTSWQNMKARCLRENHPKYPRYGGRGITICDDWFTIDGFLAWAKENGWKEGLTIDRIDYDKGYYPENCRWVSHSFNSKHKSTTKITQADAQKIRVKISHGVSDKDLSEEFYVTPGTIWHIRHNKTHF